MTQVLVLRSGCRVGLPVVSNREENDGGSVLLGNNGACDVKGIGSVRIATCDGMIEILTNVRYVLELKQNLISLGKLDRAGYSYKSENEVLKVIKDSLVKLKRTLRNDLYVLEDLWGPTKVPSMGGSRYFISIIDDFSRKMWVYPLKQKDEAFGKFLEWKKQVENQTGRKVKYPRTDNDLEFMNKKFDNFCKSEGITRHFTVMYTPQQNGLVESFNRTIMEHIRCLLTNASLPLKFWRETAQTASYARVKEGKLNKRALKYMFIGYLQEMPFCVKEQQKQQIVDQVEAERTLIDEGAFGEKSSSSYLQNYQLTRDKPQRVRQAPTRYGYADLVAYALTCAVDSIEGKPLTFEEAIVSDSKEQWKDVMEAELFSLQKNQTWSPRLPNQKLIQWASPQLSFMVNWRK
ncbi:uncharacterized protein LOC120089034 [Benincasa hispida]|uniref:uncharacterized protein LOC120089034 n=1 Tax=Benincasa hispida TaxID=102211 RepID=UPI0018FF7EFA|nr:uncharacterized protein LOC120089034 [Benincasa hispida]